jgi:hypothetical protein
MVRTNGEVVHQIGRPALAHPRTPATRISFGTGKDPECRSAKSRSRAADRQMRNVRRTGLSSVKPLGIEVMAVTGCRRPGPRVDTRL